MRDIRRDVTNLSNQQREVSPHGSLNVTTPSSNGPLNCSRTIEFHQPPHFDEELYPPLYGGRRGSFGGRGMPRHFEEVPRPQARHGEPLYDDHEHIPFVANRGRDQGDQTLVRMKWMPPSFKEWEDDVNRLDMQKHQGFVTRAKAKQLNSHKDQIEQEKFQGLNFDVQDFMGQYPKFLNKLEIENSPW
ncbi:hypothetical protein M9H77_08027 [Catharanthus roseus]|uniref:Uncharacterized protein n=1 Tax=Catharanthus roseus TaxID=4058 RepID=A0ACC0BWK1_CATRO|nr:hypothetical protein M9H77_08027 [Catharanthus roseus]